MKLKKVIAVAMVAVMSLGLMACEGGMQSGGQNDSKYQDRATKLTVSYFDGGYGSEWLYAVVEDYMDNVNQDVYVELVPSYDNATTYADVVSGVAAEDLYLIETGTFGCAEYLVDVSDVYESNAYGEEIAIKDKVGASIYEFYNEGGKYYQLPYCKGTGVNWTYNLTTLNEVFGEGNYTLPRTTDEFFALGDALYDKNTYLTVSAYADTQGGNYTPYAYEGWFAQMTGYEGFRNYFNGLYQNANGEWVLAEESPEPLLQSNKDAIEAAYEVMYKLCDKGNHYMYGDSASLTYKGSDQVFFGGGYGMKKTKVACLYTGPWVENEVEDLIEDGIIEEQEIVSAKMPVISAITKRCKTISDDETLAAVVDYVDGVTDKLPKGVSDEDAAIVKEARNIMPDVLCRAMVIPNCSDRIDEVKELLKYFASDRAQKISAQYADGINQLPFGYIPTEEELEIQMSDNVKSMYAKLDDAILMDVSHYDQPFQSATGIDWCAGTALEVSDVAIFGGNGTAPEDVYESTLAHFDNSQWPLYIDNYFKKIGE